MSKQPPLIIGIAGGTGSGKSTVAEKICEGLPPGSVSLIDHDSYYRHFPEMPLEERQLVNYDHPEALDNELLLTHLKLIQRGETVDVPQYDFVTHLRRPESRRVEPTPIVIVEGILVFVDERIRNRLDVKVFVDTAADIRVFRRIRRDMESRGRTFAQIREQYYTTVRPMHLQYVEPSKEHADLIVPEGGNNRVAIDILLSKLKHSLGALGRSPTPEWKMPRFETAAPSVSL
ncbi:MAG: uridine kinase [Myxococcota bacterium]|nr:uridine kinase [Myxococcota bacterium]